MTNDMTQSYYAIIPAGVRYDKSICANAKLLYGEITALCNQEGYCWASNLYFAKLYEVSNKSVSIWINSLINGGYLTVEIDIKNGNKRKLFISDLWKKASIPMEENFHTPMEENFQHNNIYINNTSNNTKNNTKIASNHFTKQQIQDILKYRKSIKKPIKTQQGFNGLQKKILEVVEAYSVTLDDVLAYMAEKEWQSIDKDWKEVSERFKKDEEIKWL